MRHKRYVCQTKSTPPFSKVEKQAPSDTGSSFDRNTKQSPPKIMSVQARSSTAPGSSTPSVKHSAANKVVAVECKQCNKLFRTKERLILHLQEHDKIDERGRNEVNTSNQLSHEVFSGTQQTKNNELKGFEEGPKTVKLPRAEHQMLLKKISQIEDVRQKEISLIKKLDSVKSVISSNNFKSKANTLSVPKSELLFLQEKSSALQTLNQKFVGLSLRLVKVQQFVSSKKSSSKNQDPLPNPMKLSNKSEASKPQTVSKKGATSSYREKNKLSLSAVDSKDIGPKKEKVLFHQYQGMLKKSKNLETMEQRHQFLKERLTRVKEIVKSKSKSDKHDLNEEDQSPETNENVLELHAMLEPEVIVKEEAIDFVTTSESTKVDTETLEAKTPDKFQKLKTKLQDTLSKRAKLNSKIEEIMQKKFSNNSTEIVEQRLKARLEREATVREVQRRMDEKREAEKEKELSLKEKNLRQTLEALRSDVRDVCERLSPQDGNAKKKSRREMRRHLQEKVEPKPELAMSLDSRMENIKEMEEEIAALQRRITDIRSGGVEHRLGEIKNEENPQMRECSTKEPNNQVQVDAENDEESENEEKVEDGGNTNTESSEDSLLTEKNVDEYEVENENDSNYSLLKEFGNYDVEADKSPMDDGATVNGLVIEETVMETEDTDSVEMESIGESIAAFNEDNESDSDSFNDVEEVVDDDSEELVINENPVFEEQQSEELLEVPVEFEISPENEIEDILESIIERIINKDNCISEVVSEAVIEDLMSLVIDISKQDYYDVENINFNSDESVESLVETEEDIENNCLVSPSPSEVFTSSETDISGLLSYEDTEALVEDENYNAAASQMMADILDENWSQTDTFKEVFSHDHSSREILAIFEAGSLTKQFLLESLSHLGWVNSESADFLPRGWFMKMNMDTFSRKGRVTFIFFTENLEFCLSPFEAGLYMKQKLYEKNTIETFEDNFKDDTLSESSCDNDSSFESSF